MARFLCSSVIWPDSILPSRHSPICRKAWPRPQPEFAPPETLQLERRTIDTKTGKIASSASKTAAVMWFKKGTAPEEKTPSKEAVDPNKFMTLPN